MSTATANPRRVLRALWERAPRHSPVGVEAGEMQLRLAQWRVHGNLRTWQVVQVQLPEGLAGGGHRTRLIRTAARQAGIRGGTAVCAVCTPKVDVFPLTLRASLDGSLDSQVAAQALEQLRVPAGEVVIDYARLPAGMTRGAEHTVAVLVFAIPRALAEGIVRALDRAGIEIEHLMTPACTLAAALAGGGAAERHLVVFPAEEATSISIVEGGHVLLERILPWSLRTMVGHMQTELDLEEGQCRRLLAQEGGEAAAFLEPGAAASLGSLEGALREILGPFLQDLARELVGCMGYSDSFLRRARIAGIVLAGPMAGNALLREYLGKSGELPFIELDGLAELPRRGECLEDFAYLPAASCAIWRQEVTP